MRLTMKPGVDRACTGTLPQALDTSKMACATAGDVCKPDTTSTSFISGTGLKKCMPTRRSGWRRPLAMAVTEMDEVLVASTHSAPISASSCLNRLRLMSSFSTMASTTSRAPTTCSSASMAVMRPMVMAAASGVSLALSTSTSSVADSFNLASAAAPSRVSNSITA